MEANKAAVLLHSKKESVALAIEALRPPRGVFARLNESQKDRAQRNRAKLEPIKNRLKAAAHDRSQQLSIVCAVHYKLPNQLVCSTVHRREEARIDAGKRGETRRRNHNRKAGPDEKFAGSRARNNGNPRAAASPQVGGCHAHGGPAAPTQHQLHRVEPGEEKQSAVCCEPGPDGGLRAETEPDDGCTADAGKVHGNGNGHR